MSIKTESIEKIVDVALESFGERLTAYMIAKIVNAGIAYLELDAKPIVPQYVYNSTKAMRAKSEDGLFSQDEARTVAIKFLKARINKSAPGAVNLLETIKAAMDDLDDQE
jgi:hypothetical protein